MPVPVTVTGCEAWIGSSLWMLRICTAAVVSVGVNLTVTVFFFPFDSVKLLDEMVKGGVRLPTVTSSGNLPLF